MAVRRARPLLAPRTQPGGYHLFVSHVWRHAQEQAASIKASLVHLLPSCVTFLDVDDLDDVTRIEQYVRASDVTLIVLTDAYLSSRNCRRELVAAIASAKPLVVLLESDPDRGKTGPIALRSELDSLDADGLPQAQHDAAVRLIELVERADVNAELPAAVEWHREPHLRNGALKWIAAHITHAQPAEAPRIESLDDVRIGGEPRAPDDDPCRVCLHPGYHALPSPSRFGASVFDDVVECLLEFGIAVDETEDPRLPWVILLCPGVFADGALVGHLQRLLMAMTTAVAADGSVQGSGARVESSMTKGRPPNRRGSVLGGKARASAFGAARASWRRRPDCVRARAWDDGGASRRRRSQVHAVWQAHDRGGFPTRSAEPRAPPRPTLFSTAKTFAWYNNKCDELAPQLIDLGSSHHLPQVAGVAPPAARGGQGEDPAAPPARGRPVLGRRHAGGAGGDAVERSWSMSRTSSGAQSRKTPMGLIADLVRPPAEPANETHSTTRTTCTTCAADADEPGGAAAEKPSPSSEGSGTSGTRDETLDSAIAAVSCGAGEEKFVERELSVIMPLQPSPGRAAGRRSHLDIGHDDNNSPGDCTAREAPPSSRRRLTGAPSVRGGPPRCSVYPSASPARPARALGARVDSWRTRSTAARFGGGAATVATNPGADAAVTSNPAADPIAANDPGVGAAATNAILEAEAVVTNPASAIAATKAVDPGVPTPAPAYASAPAPAVTANGLDKHNTHNWDAEFDEDDEEQEGRAVSLVAQLTDRLSSIFARGSEAAAEEETHDTATLAGEHPAAGKRGIPAALSDLRTEELERPAAHSLSCRSRSSSGRWRHSARR